MLALLILWSSTAGAAWGQPASSGAAPLRWVRSEQPRRTTSLDRVRLADSVTDAPASWDAAGPALRWRTPGVAHARISSDEAPVRGNDDDRRMLSARTQKAAPVGPAAGDVSAIPYEEADARTSPFTMQTSRGAAAPRELPRMADPKPLAGPTDADDDAAPLPVRMSAWQDDAVPESPPATGILPEPAGSVLAQPLDAAAEPCDRTYNERDCCADEKRCTMARDYVERDALSKISLDITPILRPDVTDPYSEEAERNADLARAPIRSWRDRAGHVVAVGRMNHIERRRLLVLNEDNQIQRIPLMDLCDDDLCFLSAWWRVPTECTLGDEVYAGRSWQPITLTWKATGVCHKPLYFEDVQLERYGHTMGHIKQPIMSGAHFFASLVTLPYQAGINPPWECRYPLGYYRPGSCAPWLVPPVPLSVRGALWEAGTVVGGVFLIP
ncbi:MAG: hypothetical protein MUF48_01955 [Pirellulaceae bacterium]|nr:hypothetical protein [Pirellulaceae bacterium]